MRLPANQVAVLEAASATEPRSVSAIADETGLEPETVTGAAFALEEAGLVTVEETRVESIELTEEGSEYAASGLPEDRMHRAAIELGADESAVPLDRVIGESGISGDLIDIALSNLARRGLGRVEDGAIRVESAPATDGETAAIDALADGQSVDDDILESLDRRGLVARRSSVKRTITLTDDGVTALMEGVEAVRGVGRVTPELLTSGRWQEVDFAEYNVEAGGTETTPGKEHILRQTANRVKDVLVAMGFKEMEGPHVDAQFWINDCLFMPQDHPARTHWDQFALEAPSEISTLPADLLDRVEDAHRNGVGEDGDGYHSPWTQDVARSVDLRGHTTSLSMRYLSGHAVGELEPPERYFSVEKVYRNDTLDPTHLLEFFQIEGWVMADDLSVRDLMGTFTEFYDHFGITDLQFKPHYNPYTEPSFELFGHHPETGALIEIGNSGMFRPEVLEPLGVECDVMAWGLALERLLMLMYGFEDIRDVHGTLCDIELLRNTEVVY